MTPDEFHKKWGGVVQQQAPQYTHVLTKDGLVPVEQYNQPTQKGPKKRSLGNSLLSALLGTAGAVGGTILLPGVGTALGGALGSGLGEFASEKFNHENTNLGKIGTEAALGGLFSGAGSAAKAARVGELALAEKGIASAGKELATGTAKSVATSKARGELGSVASKIQSAGRNVAQSGQGIQIGQKVGGKVITPSQANSVTDQLYQLTGGKAVSRRQAARIAEGPLNKATDQLASSIPVGSADNDLVKSIMEKFNASVAKTPGLSASASYKNLTKEIKGMRGKSLQEINDLARSASRGVYDKPGTAVLADRTATSRAFDKAVRTTLAERSPEYAAANKAYSKARNLADTLTQAAAPGGEKGINVFGNKTLTNTRSKIQSKAGNTLINFAEGGANRAGARANLGTIAKGTAIKEAIGGVVGNGLANQPSTQLQQADIAQPNQELNTQGLDTQGLDQLPTQSKYPTENLMADIQRDPKNANTYLSVYKTIQAQEKATGGSASDQKIQQQSRSANAIVDELGQLYSELGGGQGRVTGLARTVAGKAGIDNQANVYNDVRQAYLSRIARALGEVGVLTDQDIKRVAGSIPQITDNPYEAQRKIESLRSIINQFYKSAGGQNQQQNDLAGVLSQLGIQ